MYWNGWGQDKNRPAREVIWKLTLSLFKAPERLHVWLSELESHTIPRPMWKHENPCLYFKIKLIFQFSILIIRWDPKFASYVNRRDIYLLHSVITDKMENNEVYVPANSRFTPAMLHFGKWNTIIFTCKILNSNFPA